MKARSFYIVDVFAQEKYAGNQLAVVRNAAGLTHVEMQKIAKEMNYSETTFILSDNEINHGYEVRIFTPENEVPFAGHPTLGTAFIIQKEIIKSPVEVLNLNLQVGKIPVSFSYHNGEPDILWMRQIQPQFGATFQPEQIAPVLNIEISAIDNRYVIQEVSTGLPFIIVPLKDLESVKDLESIRKNSLNLLNIPKPKQY